MNKRSVAIAVSTAVVLALWSGTAMARTSSHRSVGLPDTPVTGAFGTVASVGGVSTTGTCGTGTSGAFTLNGFKSTTTYSVDVTSSTTYMEPGVSAPTFANVCVGELVGAIGGVSGTTVAATKVFIAPQHTPPPRHGVFGTVTSVAGVSTAGTCGSGTTGAFTLGTWKNTTTYTVQVDASTTYVERGQSSPSFANVCVGGLAAALGTVSGTTVQATKVFIAPATTPREPEGAFGTVTAVGGVSTAGTCRTGTSGDFTLNGFKSTTTFTVQVDASTTYVDPGVSAPSFANVCVGGLVGALGNVSGSTVAATKVFIAPQPTPPPPHGVVGTVTAVGGVSTAGTCGSGTTGAFTLSTWKHTTTDTVQVDASTTYVDPGVSAPSFANVCVGGLVGAIGSVSGSTVAATKVFIAPPSVPSFQGHKTSTHRGGPRNRR